jgi:Mg-chelatase subunit ChlD
VTLLDPIWLVLAVPLGVALWRFPLPSRLLLAFRIIALAALLLALAGAALRLPSRAGTVVVVADRSRSMPGDSATTQKEAIDLIQGAMGADDRLAVVAFGQDAAVERPPQTGPFAGFVHQVGPDASNLADALETALALVPADGAGRLLVLSDGRWTGRDPAGVTARLAARGVAVDYRLQQRPADNDLAVARIDAPVAVAPGEGFLITAWVRSPTARTVNFELKRGGERIAAGERPLAAGLNRLTFRDRAAAPGSLAYSLTVTGGPDPVPENNTARLLVGVRGPKPVLHVTKAADSGLARLLQAGGLPVKVAAPAACDWSLESLANYSAVLLENLPAEDIGTAGMETLAAWVKATGSGLMLTGGRNSYGQGGYYRSPLEPVLPVSMELRNEHRKLAVAIVVALDRSGSMAVPVGGGKVKMDLANLGTVQVLDLLGPMDEFGAIAVDTAPHTVAELATVSDKDRERIRRDVLRIESMGGGIYVYEALAASAKMVLPAKAGTKHIILFADAADAEEPGKYEELVAKCREAGITISVIGLGTPRDKDAELLRDIARRGGGRVFFSDKPEELPRLFAQDTFVVARSSFLDEPTPIKPTPGLTALAGRPFALDRPIGGYNLCYLRPEATLATVTEDEYKAPVVAAWQAGAGRVLCYTGEADGKYAGALSRSPEAGEFFTSLARWAAGQDGPLPDSMVVTQEVRNGIQRVQLHLDPARKAEPFAGLPRVTTLHAAAGAGPRAQGGQLQWAGADTLTVEIPLEGSETALTTVEVPGQKPLALPPVCLPYSPEFEPAGDADTGLLALDHLARATGGKERVGLTGIWGELPRHPRRLPVGSWLILIAGVALLLEVLERRTGLVSQRSRLVWETARSQTVGRKWFARRPRPVVAPAPAKSPTAAPISPPAEPTFAPTPAPVAVPAPAPVAESAGVLDALRRARERSRERTER